MKNLQEAILERESHRSTPFPVSDEMRLNDQDVPVTREMFVNYYTRRFPADLQRYYEILESYGDRGYPWVLEMTPHFNKERNDIQWSGINHFYMFSVSLYFMSMCTQVVGKIYGKPQMENFMRASGWPLLFCGMGGLMHPIQVVYESALFPQSIDEARYFDVLRTASSYLVSDFLDFFGGHAANLNSGSYRALCDIAKRQELEEEVEKQIALYERWVADPRTEYVSYYMQWS